MAFAPWLYKVRDKDFKRERFFVEWVAPVIHKIDMQSFAAAA
jgi:hypothetical protein